jgi:hypothetical protein
MDCPLLAGARKALGDKFRATQRCFEGEPAQHLWAGALAAVRGEGMHVNEADRIRALGVGTPCGLHGRARTTAQNTVDGVMRATLAWLRAALEVDRPELAHDLTVAQLVSGTHLGRPGVGPILPNEVLAQTWASITLLVILVATFSQIYLCIRSTGSSKHAAGSGKRAMRQRAWREMQNYTCITILHAEAMAPARDWRRVPD